MVLNCCSCCLLEVKPRHRIGANGSSLRPIFQTGPHSILLNEKSVWFCPVKETFLGSFYLYVNVLEQAGKDCGVGWPVVFWRGVEVWWSFVVSGQWLVGSGQWDSSNPSWASIAFTRW
jgi:hypothetical protein